MSAPSQVLSRPSLPLAQFLTLLINVLSVLIGLRFLLIFSGTNESQPLTAFLIPLTNPLVALFDRIVELPGDQDWMQRFDVAALFTIAGLQLVRLLLRTVERRVREVP